MPLPARQQQQGGGAACAACKYQRRRCTADCSLAPHFPHDRPRLFRNAHRLFGVSNIVKTLRRVGLDHRDDAMRAFAYEAGAWDTYPAHGCLAVIAALLHQISQEEDHLLELNALLHHYRLQLSVPTPAADLPPPPPIGSNNMHFDEQYLSSLYNNNNDDVAASLLWTMQPQPQYQYIGNNGVVDMAVPKEEDNHHLLLDHTSTGGQCSVQIQHEYDEISPFLEDIDDMPPYESSSANSSEKKAMKSWTMEGANEHMDAAAALTSAANQQSLMLWEK